MLVEVITLPEHLAEWCFALGGRPPPEAQAELEEGQIFLCSACAAHDQENEVHHVF